MKNLSSANLFNNSWCCCFTYVQRGSLLYRWKNLRYRSVGRWHVVITVFHQARLFKAIYAATCRGAIIKWLIIESSFHRTQRLFICYAVFFLAFHVYFPRILVHSSNFINVQSQPAGFKPALTEGIWFQVRRRSATTAILYPSYKC